MSSIRTYTKEELFNLTLDVTHPSFSGWVVDHSIRTNRKDSVKIGLRKGSCLLTYRALYYKVPNSDEHEIHIFSIMKDFENRKNSWSDVKIYKQGDDGKYFCYINGYPLSSYRSVYAS